MTALHANKPCDRNEYVFTSESVSEGHPDKVCDQISDAILDAWLSRDPHSRVACETLATENRIVISGEVSSPTGVDVEVEPIVSRVISDIGYTNPDLGLTITVRSRTICIPRPQSWKPTKGRATRA